MIRRLALLALVAAGLSPGLLWRDAPPPKDYVSGIVAHPVPAGADRLGPFRVEGLWQLSSHNSRFGGYSALASLDPGHLLSVSDDGRALAISLEHGAPQRLADSNFTPWSQLDAKNTRDVEALTRDPDTGRLWAAYEGSNAIERRERDMTGVRKFRPREMRGWGANSGPEAMTRLPDGRFLVLSEGPRRMFGAIHPALLYTGDPVAGAKATRFSIRMPEGYAPADMATLPDGRVLVLGRKVSLLPPGFRGALILADPAGITAGGEWSGCVLARLEPPFATDNYEGLAIVPSARARGYPVTLWLISDDNKIHVQRTLLAKLRWDGSPM